MTYKKIDKNHTLLVSQLRERGYKVMSLSLLGKGKPDLLIRNPQGVLFLIEVKTGQGKLTPPQVKFFEEWGDTVAIAHNFTEAQNAIEHYMLVLKKRL